MSFFIFCMRYTFTSKKVVVIEIPEWILKTKITRTPYLKEIMTKFSPVLGQKQQKVTILLLEVYTLVSQSLSHIIGNKYDFCPSEGLKIKILLKEFHILACLGPKCGLMLGQKWKMTMFIPATSLPIQFSLKEQFLRAIVFQHTNQTKR